MKKLFLITVLFVFVFLVFSFIERPELNELSNDISFGFLPANDFTNYHDIKAMGVDYILIDIFDEDEAQKRIDEAKKENIRIYLSAGVLSSNDFKRMELFGGDEQVEGFFLDEPHVHKENYTNVDIKKWIMWSKEKFPDKTIFIATPRIGTYEELLDIPNLKEIGFQPDLYPVMGPLTMYGAQRKLVERMQKDGFETQPIVQTHARLSSEEGMKGKYVNVISGVVGHGLIDWPAPEQVVIQIKNVAKRGVKLIWFYPGEDAFIKWTPERREYIKKVFEELKK